MEWWTGTAPSPTLLHQVLGPLFQPLSQETLLNTNFFKQCWFICVQQKGVKLTDIKLVFSFVCVHVHIHVQVNMHVDACQCGTWRSTLGIVLQGSPTLSLRQGLLLAWNSVLPGQPQGSSCLYFLSTGWQTQPPCVLFCFNVGSGD